MIKRIYRLCLIVLMHGLSLEINAQDTLLIPLEIEGEIVNTIDLPPSCGDIAWAVVFEIYVTKSTNPKYNNTTIPVLVCCPEFYNKRILYKTIPFFKNNATYRMVLDTENPAEFTWSVYNHQLLDKYDYDTFWASTIRKVTKLF